MTLLQGTILGAALHVLAVGLPMAADATHLSKASEETAAEARQRLALADKQRALVEEISEIACLVALDVETTDNIALITKLRDRIDLVLAALRNGDPALGIAGEEHYSKVIRALDRSETAWAPYRDAVNSLIDTGAVDPSVKPILFEGDYSVIEELSLLISAIESAYANPSELMMANAVMIDLIGRQELTTQAIGKDVCLMVLGWEVDLHREALEENLQILDATHQALINGMPAMGIKPAPTPEIRAALDAFSSAWAPQRAFAEKVLAGEVVEPGDVHAFLKKNIALLSSLDEILDLYADL